MKGTPIMYVGIVVASFVFATTGCDEPSPTTPQSGSVNKGSATTAQSAMLAISGDDAIAVHDTAVYQFDADAAAAYFTGGDANQRRNAARQQRCTFWSGGALRSDTVGGGKNRVIISPASSTPVAAQTAWDLTSSTTSTVDLEFEGLIIGESWMANAQHPIGDDGTGSGGKYSFSLRNEDGTSRVTDLAYSIDGGATWTSISATQGHVDDIEYVKTAGNTDLDDGWVASILLNDTHPGNDDDGADIETFSIAIDDVPAGDHDVQVRATIKGVEALTTHSFSVTRSLTVSAANCAD